jgi:hypothetical protein
MAIRVVTGSNTIVKTIITGPNTIVKKVTVGTPIRRVTAGAFDIKTIGSVDVTNLSDGAMLVYNSTTENFEATVNIDNVNTNFNGGNF